MLAGLRPKKIDVSEFKGRKKVIFKKIMILFIYLPEREHKQWGVEQGEAGFSPNREPDEGINPSGIMT